MHGRIVDVVGVNPEGLARSSDVPFFEQVKVMILVQENPHSDVKLSIEDKKRPLDVLLNDEIIVLNLKSLFLAR